MVSYNPRWIIDAEERKRERERVTRIDQTHVSGSKEEEEEEEEEETRRFLSYKRERDRGREIDRKEVMYKSS